MMLLIWGAGAIGGALGAYLIRAGHDVLFVDVAVDHVNAINTNGLRITGPIEEFSVPAKAATPDAVQGEYDIILLCTKSQHTADATRALAPHLTDDGFVVSVQNGLNELIIQEIVGKERTVGSFINYGADYHEPGVLFYGGRGSVVLGELDGSMSERLKNLHKIFRDFEENAVMTDNIWGYLWGKEAYGAMLFVTALTNESIADALDDKRYRDLYILAAREVLAVADKLGVTPLGFSGYEPTAFFPGDSTRIAESMDALVTFNHGSAKTHSGIWRDLAVRKRRTEVAMYDTITAEADRLNIPVPFTKRWIAMIHEIEDDKREQTIENLNELKASFS